MVTINRTHKDSWENAHVLLPLIGINGVQSGAARCTLGQTRYASMHTNSARKQHARNYITQIQTIPP